MNEFQHARVLFIKYLKQDAKDKFTVELLQRKLRLSKEQAMKLYQDVIESVKH